MTWEQAPGLSAMQLVTQQQQAASKLSAVLEEAMKQARRGNAPRGGQGQHLPHRRLTKHTGPLGLPPLVSISMHGRYMGHGIACQSPAATHVRGSGVGNSICCSLCSGGAGCVTSVAVSILPPVAAWGPAPELLARVAAVAAYQPIALPIACKCCAPRCSSSREFVLCVAGCTAC